MRTPPIVGAALFALIALAGTVHAACPDGHASCLLHEEGVALLLDGKFSDAAQKFQASIAAGPTARSYLGYAQAVEGLGQIALAFDTMLVAQKYSATEVTASGGKDVDVNARAERIKYKLAELRSKVAFIWLRVPDGVSPARIVSVQRQGEGDLPVPLSRWITVTPGQPLVAALDDGSRIEIPTKVGAGSQQVIVIPVTGPVNRPLVQPAATGQPLVDQYPPPFPAAEQPVVSTIGIEFAMLVPNVGNVSAGYGIGGLYERYITDRIGITGRADLLFHPDNTLPATGTTFTGTEMVLAAGVRSTPRRAFHGSLELGVNFYTQHTESFSAGSFAPVIEDYAQAYPAVIIGGGLRLGKFHAQASLVWSINPGADIEIPVRFMLTLGLNSLRR